MPNSEIFGLNIQTLAAVFAILGAVGGALFGLLRAIRWVTVPKAPDYVRECINVLRSVRSKLNTRPAVIDPVTGRINLRQPKTLEELGNLYSALRARHDQNLAIFRELSHVLFPSLRNGLRSGVRRAQRAIDALQLQIKRFEASKESDEKKRQSQFKYLIKTVFVAAYTMIEFERRLLRVIDKSLELWSRRIG